MDTLSKRKSRETQKNIQLTNTSRFIRKIEPNLWEVRSQLSSRRIARVLFTISDNKMVLLHGFIKKSQRISQTDLSIARQRRNLWQNRGSIHE